jgi:chemotaxis protein methyltransferase CheR
MVTFKRFNLLKGHPPREKFHVIFCRNVLIYFDRSAKERVVNNLCHALKAGGYLIIGGAETLSGINHPYKYIKPSIYQKSLGSC